METSLNEIIKSVNSEINNKSLSNDGLTAEFYKYFSNELLPVFLYVYDSWRKFGTMCVTSKRGIRKKDGKKDISIQTHIL